VLAGVAATGTTLVVVTHEVGALAGVLTRAVVVDHGHLAYDGPLSGAASTGTDAHHPGDEPQPSFGPGLGDIRLGERPPGLLGGGH
jgi:zinc transport system ATP-binding protein